MPTPAPAGFLAPTGKGCRGFSAGQGSCRRLAEAAESPGSPELSAWGAGGEGCSCPPWTRRERRLMERPGKAFRLVLGAKASGAEPSRLESEGWPGICGGAPRLPSVPRALCPACSHLLRLLLLSAQEYLPRAARKGPRWLQRSPRGKSPVPGARLG